MELALRGVAAGYVMDDDVKANGAANSMSSGLADDPLPDSLHDPLADPPTRGADPLLRNLDAEAVSPSFYLARTPQMLIAPDARVLETNLSARHLFALRVLSRDGGGRLQWGEGLAEEAKTLLADIASGKRGFGRILRRGEGGRWTVFELDGLGVQDGPVLVRVNLPEPPDAQALDALAKALSLSPAELRVAEQMCEGKSAKAIAQALELSPATVRSHMRAVYAKAGEEGYHRTLRRLLALLA